MSAPPARPRRPLRRGGFVPALVACLLAASAPAQDATSAGRAPATVVLVTASWHRADHVNLAFRGVDVETPNLDDLARRGVLFERASTVAVSPRASAAALLTGTAPPASGVLDEATRLGDAAPTLAERFAEAGWFTAASLGERPLGDPSGLLQGFGRSAAPRDARRRAAEDVVRQALELLDEAGGRDAFLWVHLGDAAWPHDPPQAVLDRYFEPRDDPRDPRLRTPAALVRAWPLPYADVTDRNWPWCRYKASITALDAALAPLLAAPRVRAGSVAYVGLHGMALGQSGLFYKAFGTAPEMTDVPLLLAAPGVGASVRDARPASVLDVGRTLLDLAGLDASAFPGRDLLAPGARDGDVFVLDEHGVCAALTRDGLHLVVPLQPRRLPFLVDKRNQHEAMLYDLAADPLLEHDLLAIGEDEAAAAPRELGERGLGMLRDLFAWVSVDPAPDWWEAGERDPDEDALDAELGYSGRPLATRRPPWRHDGCPLCLAVGAR